ncbi:MAG: hypothetical protein V1897_19355 [Pseudomonadota bacterium]
MGFRSKEIGLVSEAKMAFVGLRDQTWRPAGHCQAVLGTTFRLCPHFGIRVLHRPPRMRFIDHRKPY